jgi:hypothetical protein
LFSSTMTITLVAGGPAVGFADEPVCDPLGLGDGVHPATAPTRRASTTRTTVSGRRFTLTR